MSIRKASKKNIALIGARGAGKSKLARRLGKLCGRPVLSTDSLLSYENDGLSISEIVEQLGWLALRRLEHEILLKLSQAKNIIVDCGGGILVDVETLSEKEKAGKEGIEYKEKHSKEKSQLLKKHCYVIYLHWSKKYLIEKNVIGPQRPAFSSLFDDYKKLLKARIPDYKKTADLILDMEGFSIDKAAYFLYKKYYL